MHDESRPHHDPEQQYEEDGPAATARQAGRALFGPDLIAPAPGVWPFGQAAKQRRAQRRAVLRTAAERRSGLQDRWAAGLDPDTTGRSGRWAPVPRRRHAMVLTGMGAAVAGLVVLSWWSTSDSPDEPPSAGAAPAGTEQPPASPDPAPDEESAPGQQLQLPPVEPIPSDGVAPIVPGEHSPAPDPAQVPVVPAPAGEPDVAALSTPESAAVSWMARWCPFDTRDELGAAEQRAQPAMTEHGWSLFDPRGDEQGHESWRTAQAASERGACAQPQAQVIAEAPRSESSAIVQVSTDRVVTSSDGKYVERLSERRIVQRGPDGAWRVDSATHGG